MANLYFTAKLYFVLYTYIYLALLSEPTDRKSDLTRDGLFFGIFGIRIVRLLARREID
jgi:hypothetical protein